MKNPSKQQKEEWLEKSSKCKSIEESIKELNFLKYITENRKQIIMPRKGVLELQRLLEDGDGEIVLEVGNNHLRVSRSDVTFSTKLIEGKFPDYEAVIPIGADKEIRINRDLFRNALQRAAILSNEKFKGVKLDINLTVLNIVAHNPEQEEAQEEIEIESAIDGISIGFNVNYLLEALSALREDTIIIMLRDGNSSALVREASHERSRHVVMPLRL